LTQAIRFSSWDIICSAPGSRSLYSSDGTSRPSTRVTTVRLGRTVTDPCRAYARLSRVDQHQSIDEQHPVYKCSVNSSQQWQQGVWCAGQLVTTRCFSRRSTRYTILGCDELTVWRVDWHPVTVRRTSQIMCKIQYQLKNSTKHNDGLPEKAKCSSKMVSK